MKVFMFVLFGALTSGAIYMTYYDVGAGEPKLTTQSVRSGSLGNHRYYGK